MPRVVQSHNQISLFGVLLCLPVFAGPGKNDNAEKVAEKLEALSVKEARDEAEEKSEEKQ